MIKSYQEQYSEILRKLINEPQKIVESRVGKVRSRFVEQIRVDVRKEFPLMELKKIKFSNILHELLWFVRGESNIKYLRDNQCLIWDGDAYRYYQEKYSNYSKNKLTKEEFLEKVMNEDTMYYPDTNVNHPYDKYSIYRFGDLDRIYGFQWRRFNGKTDQLGDCINKLNLSPDDRRMIVSAHNPTDLKNNQVGLPSCHNYFQFYSEPIELSQRYIICIDKLGIISTKEEDLDAFNVPKRYLSIFVNIRSNDWFLGQPYNMASYTVLLKMIAQLTNMIPKEVVINAVDAHLYEEHLEPALKFLKRYEEVEGMNTFCKSKLFIDTEVLDIDDFEEKHFKLKNYTPQSYIKAKLLT